MAVTLRLIDELRNDRFLTHHLDCCCTTPLLCLTCVKTINLS